MALNVNISDSQVFQLVADNIKKKIPFSLTRFGDGEIFFLNNNVPTVLREKVCTLWNYNKNEFPQAFTLIRSILITALKNSKCIGIMGNNEISKRLKSNITNWEISDSIIREASIPEDTLICDHQLTRGSLFGDIHSFKTIIKNASVNIVSPNAEKLKKNKIHELLDTHVSYTLIMNNRDDLLNRIESIKEDVVLFGASLMGKDIGTILQAKGKICLDFGATLDAWAGIISRPWFNDGNLQQHCLIKKTRV